MIDLGTVRPGSTIRIPFSSFDKDDGSSITMTNYAVGDILIYKDGNTTARASTNGFTATTDFNSKTGKHLAVIDLSDNSTAGFFAAGSEYIVAIDAVTVDTVTTGGWIARFRIGYVGAILDTTISSLGTSSNQSVFALTSGPPENNALAGMWAIIHDVASATQIAVVVIESYQAATRTVILASNPAFGIAASDNISVMGPAPLQPTAQKLNSTGRTLDVSATGEAGLDWANIGSPTTTVGLTGTTISSSQVVASVTGSVGSVTGAVGSVAGNVGGNVTGSVGSVASSGISAASFAADVDAEILSYVVDDATRIDASALNTLSSHDPGATIGTSTLTQTQVTGGAFALNSSSFAFHSSLDLTTTQKASVNTEVDTAISDVGLTTTVTGRIDTTISSRLASASYTAPLSAAQTQTECEEALQTYHLDHLIASADPGGVVANSSFLAKLVSKSATPAFSSYDNTTDSFEALRDNVGTNGGALSLAKTTNITGFNDLSAAQVNAEADTALSDVGLTTTVTGRIDVAVSSRLATSGYTAPLDAAGVRSAVGLASANLDTQLDALPTAAENASGLLDLSNGIETGVTPKQAIRAMAAILAGIISGGGTGTEVFKAIAAASGGTTRVTVTVDNDGNRSAVTLNL